MRLLGRVHRIQDGEGLLQGQGIARQAVELWAYSTSNCRCFWRIFSKGMEGFACSNCSFFCFSLS